MTSRVGATPESVEMHARDKAPSIADTASVQAEAYVVGDASTIAAAAAAVERVGWTVWMLTMSAALCGSLLGYDTGYVSSVLVSLDDFQDFGQLGDGTKHLITSATSLGALIGALCAKFHS